MVDFKIIAIKGNKDIRYSDIKEKLDAVRELYPDAMWISNGDIGTELIAAKYALLNKIPLYMCIPFPPEIMSAMRVKGWREILYEVLEYAQRVSIGSDSFSFKDYQKCNERMINHADVVVVFNQFVSSNMDGCIRYAISVGKLVLDGFSLSTPKVAELHARLLAQPIMRVITIDNLGDSYEEAVYENGIAL